jgi:hypothetical protein
MYYTIKMLRVGFLAAIGAGLVLSGCATTSPNAAFRQALPKAQRLGANDTANVKIEAAEGVFIDEYEKQRLARNILGKIDMQKLQNPDSSGKREYEIAVLLTRYEKGNAFARFMLAGLGQIHIDAKASVFQLPERMKVSEFDIDKTFAWGGIYGGMTSIEDVEHGFAEGVAQAVTSAKD